MPFIPAPQIIQVEIRGTLAGQQIENRINVDNLAPVTDSDLSSVALEVLTWAETEYMQLITASFQLTEVVATDMTNDSGGQVTMPPSTPTFGVVGSEAMPNEVTLCASLRSASRGRSARGRLFLLNLPRSQVVENNVIPAHMAAAITALNGLKTAISSLGKAWVVVSYRHNGVVRPGGPVYYPITNILFVDSVVDSQRKRKPGVGS